MLGIVIYSAIVLTVVIAIFVAKRPGWALAVLITHLMLVQWLRSVSVFFLQYDQLPNYVGAWLLMLAIIFQAFKGSLSLRAQPAVSYVCWGLLLYAGVSLLWSDVGVAYGTSIWMHYGAMLVFAAVLAPLTLFAPDDFSSGIKATLILGLFVEVLVLASGNWGWRGLEYAGEFQSTSAETNPLVIGTFGGTLACIAALINFTGIGRSWNIFRWIVVAVSLYVAHRSGSRGPTAVAVLCILLYLPLSRRLKSARGLVATMAGVIFLGLAVLVVYEELGAGRWAGGQQDKESRFTAAGILLTSYLEHPGAWLFGMGNSSSWAIFRFYSHVVPAEVLYEEGLVGISLLAWILFLTARSAKRIYAVVRDNPLHRGVLACFCAFISMEVLQWLTQGSLIGSSYFYAYVMLLGRYEIGLRQATAMPVVMPVEELHEDDRPLIPQEVHSYT